MTKEKCLKEYRATAKRTHYYESIVQAGGIKEAWEKALEQESCFERCEEIRNGWELVRITPL